MRLATFFMLIGIFNTFAGVYSQSDPISVNIQNGTLIDLFNAIESKTDYKIFYRTSLVDETNKIDLVEEQKSVSDLLIKALAGKNLLFTLIDKVIVITPEELVQQTTISGKITDAVTGDPLPGVNVMVEGTTMGVISDVNGKYTIVVNSGDAVLIFSFIGYVSEKISVTGKSQIDVVLAPDIQKLDEVVVVGYGTSLKKDLTTAISKVDPSKVPKAANNSVNELLFGRSTGVQVTQQSAQPGGQIDLSIRGRGNPLIVIDGIIIPNNDLDPGVNFSEINNVRRGGLGGINPNDIESIQFLKDASAAIYGVEAGNGVVIITTKKGKEGKIKVSYNGSRSVQKNMSYLEPLNANEYMKYYNQLQRDYWYAHPTEAGTPFMAPFGTTPATDPILTTTHPIFTQSEIDNAGEGHNWLNEIFREGSIDNHTLTIDGGSEKFAYYASANYFNQVGTVKNSDLTKYNGKLDLSFKLNKFIKLNTGIVANRNNYNNTVAGWQTGGAGQNGFTALQAALAFPAYIDVKDANGNYTQHQLVGNPVGLLDIKDRTENTSFLSNNSLEITIIPEVLSAKVIYGLNMESAARDFFIPSTTNWFDANKARASLGTAKRQDQTFNSYITFNKKFFEILNINMVAGFEEIVNSGSGFGIQSSEMLDAVGTNNVAAGKNPIVNSNKYKSKKRSYFSRASFDLNDRYIITGAIRYDGYSEWFPESKYKAFPGISLGWKVSNEPFLKSLSNILDLFKLRASYGTTGSLLPPGAAYGVFKPENDNVGFDGSIFTPYYLDRLDKRDLTWAKTINKNFGIDLGLFKNRFTLAFDLFQDDITDLLNSTAPTPALSFLPSQAVNGGHQVRKGYEIQLNSDNFRGKNFKWSTIFNLSHYSYNWKERFKEVTLTSYQRVNDPVNVMYRFKTDGILQIGETPSAFQPSTALIPGSPKFVDVNNDNILDSADVVKYNQTPKFSIGLGNTFQYKNFDLTIFFYGQFGAYKENFSLAWANPGNILGGYSGTKDLKDVWTSANTNGTLPGANYLDYNLGALGNVSGVGSDYDIQKADFLRCRNITLGYRFNQNLIKSFASDLRLYFDIQNAFIITKYKGADPEILVPGVKGGAAPYPMSRTFSFGVNITF